MAITKSAKKALRQNLRRKARNLRKREGLKKLLKEVKKLVGQKKVEEVKKLLPRTYRALDKAAKTGLMKKGTADRKKSRIARSIKKLS